MTDTSPQTNTDFTIPIVVDVSALAWHASPNPAVWRKSLYREGGEYGPVTSVVRYDAASRFASHVHPGGEEILVLDGVFSDERGDYPTGVYLLNPEGSAHAPFSREGCLLFVRLRQYAGKDRPQLVLNTVTQDWATTDNDGVVEKSLYRQSGYAESMSLLRCAPGAAVRLPAKSGIMEIFVIDGAIQGRTGNHQALSWLRLPPATAGHTLQSRSGALLYVRMKETGNI